jgi:mannose-1-phosphate guanylyltransferase/mannose-6-phosphate isomerase
MIIPVILAGGTGTRLWPLSRQGYPKQFIPLLDDHLSLYQQTLARAAAVTKAEPIVICNESNRFMVAEQLLLLKMKAQILLEPCGRNTAPAIALAALHAQRVHPDQSVVLWIMPSDQIVESLEVLTQAVTDAARLAVAGQLVTFGVQPSHAETGYGYIQAGEMLANSRAQQIAQFVEKPSAVKAAEYIAAGNYYWNSGMFVLAPQMYVKELQQHAPDMLIATQTAYENRQEDADFVRFDQALFSQVRAESIDYAVMERTSQAAMVVLDTHWSDVGSWSAVADELPKDANHNISIGDVMLEDCEDCLVRADSRLVAAIGLKNIVVVETADAVLITDKDNSQDVKTIVTRLKQKGREEINNHTRVYRPWGWYESICHSERFQVKRIQVNPGQRLSLQMHYHRAEHWVVVSGTAEITRGDKVEMLTEDQSTYITLGIKHRLTNPGKIPLEIIEVQTGSYLGEDDIVRFDDQYGRG